MIYYFSGTGNSEWVARKLASLLGEQLISIAEAMAQGNYRYALQPGEKIGWVFPTYSWGPAPIVTEFIAKWHIDGYCPNETYCYLVTTCGDEVGLAPQMWQQALGTYIIGNATFSVQMPNNYILLPGFDVDSAELEQQKKHDAIARVEHIAKMIEGTACVNDVVVGSWKRLKSKLIYPLFKKYYTSDKGFRTDEKCNGCAFCEKSCPMHNIEMHSGKPTWKGNCAMCLSCIHRCPKRAIQFGSITRNKGRYFFK